MDYRDSEGMARNSELGAVRVVEGGGRAGPLWRARVCPTVLRPAPAWPALLDGNAGEAQGCGIAACRLRLISLQTPQPCSCPPADAARAGHAELMADDALLNDVQWIPSTGPPALFCSASPPRRGGYAHVFFLSIAGRISISQADPDIRGEVTIVHLHAIVRGSSTTVFTESAWLVT